MSKSNPINPPNMLDELMAAQFKTSQKYKDNKKVLVNIMLNYKISKPKKSKGGFYR